MTYSRQFLYQSAKTKGGAQNGNHKEGTSSQRDCFPVSTHSKLKNLLLFRTSSHLRIMNSTGQLNHCFPLNALTGSAEGVVIEQNGFRFQLRRNSCFGSSLSICHQISLELIKLPNSMGAIIINYSLRAPTISFHKTRHGVHLKTKELKDYEGWSNDFENSVSDDFSELNQYITSFSDSVTTPQNPHITALQKPIHIHCDIEITTKYGLFGEIYSSVDRPIFVKSAVDHTLLVPGFVDDLFAFDECALYHIPRDICNLIHRYYLMLLLDRRQSTHSAFEWRFRNKSDVSMFQNCRKGDVLTSVKFQLCECEFYLELTPNGWSHQKKGQCCLWIAVSSLHPTMRSVTVAFNMECKEINHKEDRPRTTLQEPQNGSFSATANNRMNRKQFDGLDGWTFECTVHIMDIQFRSDINSNDIPQIDWPPREKLVHNLKLYEDRHDGDSAASPPLAFPFLRRLNSINSVGGNPPSFSFPELPSLSAPNTYVIYRFIRFLDYKNHISPSDWSLSIRSAVSVVDTESIPDTVDETRPKKRPLCLRQNRATTLHSSSDPSLVILQPYRSDGSHTDTGSGGDNGTTTPFVRYRHSECLSVLKGSCLYL